MYTPAELTNSGGNSDTIDSIDESDPEMGLCAAVTGGEMQTSTKEEDGVNRHISASGQPDRCAVENDTVAPDAKLETPCKWSECSICIEEFQPADKITILPRCQHAYHRACIQPWLLEKQNFCPLCKTPVLPEPDQQTASDRSSEDGVSLAEASNEPSPSDLSIGEQTEDGSTNTQRRDEETTSGR